MEEPAWWPSGIAQQSQDEAQKEGELRTSFGRVQLWDTTEVLDPSWWNSPPGNGVQWGEWPTDVEQIDLVSEDAYGLLVRIDGAFVARICPFFVGEDVSRMARFEPWNVSLESLPLLLPIGGWTAGEHDRVLIYPAFESTGSTMEHEQVISLVETMSGLHSVLAPFETPNTERLWNERLKAMEDRLKPHTMWRAPHTAATVGLPRLNLDLHHLASTDKGLLWIALPRPLADHLVCQPERLPSLSGLMRLERQWAMHVELNADHREAILTTWGVHTPPSWSKGKALSTALGGAWVWRYNAVLEQLSTARCFGDKELEATSLAWLGEVSRLQARLGTLRMWKSGLWVAITGLVVAFFGHELETFSSLQSMVLAGASLAFGVITNRVYWAKDPPPY